MATGEKEGEGAASETEVDSQGKRRRGAWWSGFFKKSNRSAGFLVKLVDQEEGIRFWLEGEAGAAGVTGGGGDGSAGGRRSALARALARQHVRLRDPKAISGLGGYGRLKLPVVAARDIGETAAMETEVATPTMALMVPGSASPLLGCYGATTPPPILGALISVKRHSRPSGVGRWCYILVGICLCESNMHVCVFSFPLPVTNTSRKMVAVAGSKRRHPLDARSCPMWPTPRKTTAAHKKKEEAA